MTTDKELKPCPFCGEAVEVFGEPNFAAVVRCKDIHCDFYVRPAVENWNSAYCWKLLAERDARIKDLEDQLATNKFEDVLALEKEIAELKESLKIKHFSSCSDGSCDNSCEKVFKHHFNCWLKQELQSERGRIQELEREKAIAVEALNKLSITPKGDHVIHADYSKWFWGSAKIAQATLHRLTPSDPSKGKGE